MLGSTQIDVIQAHNVNATLSALPPVLLGGEDESMEESRVCRLERMFEQIHAAQHIRLIEPRVPNRQREEAAVAVADCTRLIAGEGACIQPGR